MTSGDQRLEPSLSGSHVEIAAVFARRQQELKYLFPARKREAQRSHLGFPAVEWTIA
ncbi:MAG: hypothetical protein MZV70_60010 [Desulfobacterales bacterium]|nr:hypothetical protein [Desulfobacterales bacterium]